MKNELKLALALLLTLPCTSLVKAQAITPLLADDTTSAPKPITIAQNDATPAQPTVQTATAKQPRPPVAP